MFVPRLVFVAQHVGLVALIAMAYPTKYRPSLYAFAVVQGIAEHYADVFPAIAAIGPFLIPIAISLLGLHYYYANKVIADKRIIWGGFVFYFVLLIFAKTQEWG